MERSALALPVAPLPPSEARRSPPRGPGPVLWLLASAASCALAPLSLRADTIFLKDGTQILDCQVTEETDARVSVRTPVGDMVVPRSAIQRIQRVKTVHDLYAEQFTRLRQDDVNGLFKLALWCRSTEGLRKESDELLSRVISLKADHAEARRLLGHLKVGKEWVVPEPLSLRLVVSGGHEADLRKSLDLFLRTRQDVRLAPESKAQGAAGDSLDSCTLALSVVISRKAATRFYGQAVGQPTFGATVRIEARGPWIGKTNVQTAVEGQVPGNGGSASLGIQNAIGKGSASIHRFLDQLTALRAKKLRDDLRKKEQEVALEKKASREAP